MADEDTNAEMERGVCEQTNREDSDQPDWFLKKVLAAYEVAVRRKLEQDVKEALEADDTAVEDDEVVTVKKAAVDKKKKKKKKATTTKATGTGEPIAAKDAVKPANQAPSTDELCGVVYALDEQVQRLFEQTKGAMVYAKSGQEVLQHQVHHLRDEFKDAKKRNEQMEKRLEKMEKKVEVLGDLVKTLMKS